MNLRTLARLFGVVFVVVGILGFIPGVTTHHHDPDVKVTASEGMLLGLFHINVLHNLVHILFGVWGLAAGGSVDASRIFFRGMGVIYVVLAILGLIPTANIHNTFGLIPISGNDIWLHALLGVIGLYLGFAARASDAAPVTPPTEV
jgi:hypothetical protein